MFNPRGTFTNDLSLFGSWVQDIPAADLPLGASPDNADCFYLPGSVFTRPALKAAIPDPAPGDVTIMSIGDFAAPSGDDYLLYLDSLGLLRSNLADDTGQTLLLSQLTPGVQFKTETAFNKQWFAFYSYLQISDFSDNPFVGVDVPLYFNGEKLYRVTSDAPGAGPAFTNVAVQPVPLIATSPSSDTLTIVSATVSGRHGVYDPTTGKTEFYYDFMIVTCTTAVPVDWFALSVTITGNVTGGDPDANGTWSIIEVDGDTFTVPYGGPQLGPNSGGTATVSSAGNFMVRSRNIVTAYVGATEPANLQVGFWAQFLNDDGSPIVGPAWSIPNIVRDETGLVTVTVSTQLQNLPVGAILNIAATDTSDFPPGPQKVTRVISITPTQTIFAYQSLTTTAAASTAGGTVTQNWTPTGGIYGNAAQIRAIGFDVNLGWFVQFYELGPDTALPSYGTIVPQMTLQSQIAAGQRSGVCMFASVDGAITAPSVPIQFSTTGGPSLLAAGMIPVGPPGTARRILAFTPSEGANYYYISPTTFSSLALLDLIAATGTVINDNTTTAAFIDFSDTQLVSGTQIDVEGNNLFNQIVLAPCLGTIEYEGREFWWGEINNIKNLINPGFDGGYTPPSGTCFVIGTAVTWISGKTFEAGWAGAQILLDGQLFTIDGVSSDTSLTLLTSAGMPYGIIPFMVYSPIGALPLGWDASQGDGEGSLAPNTIDLTEFGFSYVMKTGFNNQIQQAAANDFFGGPIFAPSTGYHVRMKAKVAAANKNGVVVVDLYSAISGGILASTTFPLISMSTGDLAWIVRDFDVNTPAVLPPDTVLEVYLLSTVADGTVTIDELEFIPTDAPVSFDQVRGSYFQNPFGYDSITGIMSIDPSENITAAFRQRGYLYLNSDKSLFQSQNNGTGEPSTWNTIQYVGVCGCSGPNAVDFGEEFALWAGRYGIREFTGDPTAKKISQEFAKTWESINWNAQTTIWLKNDSVDRLIFCGIPIGTAAMPSKMLQMSYRLNDTAYNVPDPIHVSQYSGKLIVTDLGRRWSPWSLPINCAEMCVRPLATGLAKTIVFGGGNGQAPGAAAGFGNLYQLDLENYWPLDNDVEDWNCVDLDYGAIDAFYTTAFFFQKEAEQQPIVGSFRKLFNFVSIHATGVGKLQISPIIDALNKIQDPLPAPTLELQDPGFDYEFHPTTRGNRCAYRMQATASYPSVKRAFALSQMNVSGRKDMIFPIRGTVFGG